MTRLRALLAACALTLAAPFTASAEGAPVVLELFTSQGCSSCPPADELLGRYADDDDVIALSLHVDYWDYLGWKDVFGLPVHTARQKRYAKTQSQRMIYTPQIVVNGAEGMVGSRAAQVEEAIARHAAADPRATVALSLQGDRLTIATTPGPVAATRKQLRDTRIVMAWYTRAETVSIGAGENTGRRITYHNVVRGWSDLGEWDGGEVTLTAPKPMAADGVAVLVQAGRGGPILGAGRIGLVP